MASNSLESRVVWSCKLVCQLTCAPGHLKEKALSPQGVRLRHGLVTRHSLEETFVYLAHEIRIS